LWWNYRPDRDQWIRTVHEVTAIALLAVAVALVVLAILRRGTTGAPGVVAGVGVLVTVGGAYVLGRLLPWDQLALWAVTTARGSGLGVAMTFNSRVKYVLIDGREVSASTYHWWAMAHVALSALVVLALVLVWLRTRDGDVSRRPRPTPEPEPAPEPEPRG
jgi:quinol-cytochrome oxidoreductase complex cytochrome b subunit